MPFGDGCEFVVIVDATLSASMVHRITEKLGAILIEGPALPSGDVVEAPAIAAMVVSGLVLTLGVLGVISVGSRALGLLEDLLAV